jgi:hypothetical protein
MAEEGRGENIRGQLIDRARQTIVALGQAVDGKEPKAQMQTDTSTLRAIAELMASMLEDLTACGGANCMGRTIDGFKLWITQDRFERTQARNAQLEQALRSINRAGGQADEDDMLIDWRETAKSMSRLAGTTLDGFKP